MMRRPPVHPVLPTITRLARYCIATKAEEEEDACYLQVVKLVDRMID
jgi:hypothetical protein